MPLLDLYEEVSLKYIELYIFSNPFHCRSKVLLKEITEERFLYGKIFRLVLMANAYAKKQIGLYIASVMLDDEEDERELIVNKVVGKVIDHLIKKAFKHANHFLVGAAS